MANKKRNADARKMRDSAAKRPIELPEKPLEKLTPFSVKMTAEQLDMLGAIARNEDRSAASVVRRLIEREYSTLKSR